MFIYKLPKTRLSVTQINHKDSELFAQLFEQYKEPFARFAYSFVRDKVVAESLFVDALVDFWQRREQLPDDTNVPSYILTALRNKALNYMRHQRVKLNAVENIKSKVQADLEFRIGSLENFTSEQLFVNEIGEIVNRTIASMPPQTRRIFEMSRFENRKNAEIAKILGVSIKTVEFHITKMLKVLRENLKDYICFLILFFIHID